MSADTEGSKPTPGPSVLNERTITGVFVHLLGLLPIIGLPLVGLISFGSSHPFTRTNAQNVLNWYLSVLVVTVPAFVCVLLGGEPTNQAGEVIGNPIIPGPIGTAFAIVGIVLLLLTVAASFSTPFLAVYATYKAIRGNAVEYPFARRFLGTHPEEEA